jgi:hypothetical protein
LILHRGHSKVPSLFCIGGSRQNVWKLCEQLEFWHWIRRQLPVPLCTQINQIRLHIWDMTMRLWKTTCLSKTYKFPGKKNNTLHIEHIGPSEALLQGFTVLRNNSSSDRNNICTTQRSC